MSLSVLLFHCLLCAIKSCFNVLFFHSQISRDEIPVNSPRTPQSSTLTQNQTQNAKQRIGTPRNITNTQNSTTNSSSNSDNRINNKSGGNSGSSNPSPLSPVADIESGRLSIDDSSGGYLM